MQSLAYEIVDVFTDTAFAGNPLAVVFDADDLETAALQALAGEFHLSETVFVMAPSTPDATYRARIFTVDEELPFAGHPSVGAAVTLMRRGAYGPGEVIQECGAGLLPIQVHEAGSARLAGGTATVGDPIDPAPLLESVGLTAADLAGPAPRVAGCGLEFHYLPVRPEALARSRGDAAAADRHGIWGVSVFAWDPARNLARTRVFAGAGFWEDPATGSAALGFGVWLVASGLVPARGETAYTVVQGVEMGRTSTLAGTVRAEGGRAVATSVTGSVVPVARGEIRVPRR